MAVPNAAALPSFDGSISGGRACLDCLHASVGIMLLGGFGMLVGARLDFGQFGLAAIADWCSSLPPASVDALLSRVTLAPWTCLGMLLGCNLGMALAQSGARRATEPIVTSMLRCLVCNATMIAGMLIAESWALGARGVLASVPAEARMLGSMLFGMTVGLWVGWWSAGRLLRVYSRSLRSRFSNTTIRREVSP